MCTLVKKVYPRMKTLRAYQVRELVYYSSRIVEKSLYNYRDYRASDDPESWTRRRFVAMNPNGGSPSLPVLKAKEEVRAGVFHLLPTLRLARALAKSQYDLFSLCRQIVVPVWAVVWAEGIAVDSDSSVNGERVLLATIIQDLRTDEEMANALKGA